MSIESLLYQEIHQQPEVIANLTEQEIRGIKKLADAIRERGITNIVIAARGTSDNAGRYAKYVLGALNGYQVALATPSLFTHYQKPVTFHNSLVLGISQSGASPDIVAVLSEAQRQNQLTAVITNTPGSPLAQTSDFVIHLHAGEEKAVAATKTYTSSLMAIALLSALLNDDQEALSELQAVPEKMRQTLGLFPKIQSIVPSFIDMKRCVVIGRGYNYSTAFETGLKLKELSYTVVEPYSTADFLHGPLALIEDDFPVIVINPSGILVPDTTSFIDKVTSLGAKVISISDLGTTNPSNPYDLTIPANCPEWISPLLTILPGQLFGYSLAHQRGYDVDQPRAINKVTETM